MGDNAVTRPTPLDLAGFLALYPWREEELEATPIERVFHYDLPAAPEVVWPYVADNSRMSFAYGGNRMELEERDGVLHGRARYTGFLHRWVEVPWSWVEAREFILLRDFYAGPQYILRSIARLEPLDGGAATRLYVYYGFVPRTLIARLGVPVWLRRLRVGYDRVIELLRAGLGRPVDDLFRMPVTPLADSARERLARIRRDLVERQIDAGLLDRTIGHVTEADDLAVYRIQVRRLARDWAVDERDLLEVFLHATRAGLLEMSWDVMCPHCRGVREEAATLADVAERSRCDVCEIDFETSAENAIEITFHVHPSIRRVEKVYYCSAEPATKQHIKLQQHVRPGERRELATRLGPGHYRVRRKGSTDVHPIEVVPGGEPRVEIDASRGAPADARLAPGAVLALHNPGDASATVVIEERGWTDDALRPQHLFNLQAFRDLFSEEYLAASVQLHVGEQTILFTDIVGSTRYYRQVGDPGAFSAVKRHFGGVFDAVRSAGGAVVKTIGDAVMASFADPVAAVDAALAIHRVMDGGPDAPAPFRLRISINRGPCIAVNLNSGVDYFGGTVNTAAKLQRCADAGEIALGDAVWRAPGVEAALAARGARLRSTTLHHEALGELPVVVVADAAAQASPAANAAT